MPWFIVQVDSGSLARLRHTRDHGPFRMECGQVLELVYDELGVKEEATKNTLLWPDRMRRRMTLPLTVNQASCLLGARPPVFMETGKPKRKRKGVDKTPTLW